MLQDGREILKWPDGLIIQDFDIEPFQQGIPVGPKWLLKTLRGEDLSADIAAYDEALIAQRETELAARDKVKATKDVVLKAKKKIYDKSRDKRRAEERTDEQTTAKRLRDSKRVRTDEQTTAKRLRDSKRILTDDQKTAKQLRDSKRIRTKRNRTNRNQTNRAYSPAQKAAKAEQRRAKKKQKS